MTQYQYAAYHEIVKCGIFLVLSGNYCEPVFRWARSVWSFCGAQNSSSATVFEVLRALPLACRTEASLRACSRLALPILGLVPMRNKNMGQGGLASLPWQSLTWEGLSCWHSSTQKTRIVLVGRCILQIDKTDWHFICQNRVHKIIYWHYSQKVLEPILTQCTKIGDRLWQTPQGST